MGEFIEFRSVTKEYLSGQQKVKALSDVSFSIGQGEFVVILGPSGAGKSTVLNLLGGMDFVSQGSVLVGEEDIAKFGNVQLTRYRAQEVGFVFQFYNLIPTLTAYENVALMKEVVKDIQKPEEALASVGLDRQRNQFPSQLSGGEQQRVAIARAVCKNPRLLLCDEPTGALDTETGVKVLTLLREMCKSAGRTVVIVTHNTLLAEIAHRVIHLKNGKVQEIIINSQPKRISEVSW